MDASLALTALLVCMCSVLRVTVPYTPPIDSNCSAGCSATDSNCSARGARKKSVKWVGKRK